MSETQKDITARLALVGLFILGVGFYFVTHKELEKEEALIAHLETQVNYNQDLSGRVASLEQAMKSMSDALSKVSNAASKTTASTPTPPATTTVIPAAAAPVTTPADTTK